MKRKLPITMLGKAAFIVRQNWLRLLGLCLLGVVSTFLMYGTSSATPAHTTLTTLCLYQREMKKGDKLTQEDITQKAIPAEYFPENALSNCQSQEAIGKTLTTNVQAGDLVQASNLSTVGYFRQSDSMASPSAQKTLLYLNTSDIHTLPPNLQEGQLISILGKSKETQESVIVADKIQIAHLPIIQNENDQEVLMNIGVLINMSTAQKLSASIAEKWSLHILIQE